MSGAHVLPPGGRALLLGSPADYGEAIVGLGRIVRNIAADDVSFSVPGAHTLGMTNITVATSRYALSLIDSVVARETRDPLRVSLG